MMADSGATTVRTTTTPRGTVTRRMADSSRPRNGPDAPLTLAAAGGPGKANGAGENAAARANHSARAAVVESGRVRPPAAGATTRPGRRRPRRRPGPLPARGPA